MSTQVTPPIPPSTYRAGSQGPQINAPVPPQDLRPGVPPRNNSDIEITPSTPGAPPVRDLTAPKLIETAPMPRQMEAAAPAKKLPWTNRLSLLASNVEHAVDPSDYLHHPVNAAISRGQEIANDIRNKTQQYKNNPMQLAGDTAGFLTGMVGTGGFGEGPEVRISPETFINKVSSPESHVNPEVVKAYRAQIRNGEPIEPLKIEMDKNGNVLNADGRHRALAAMQEGVKTLPVQVTRPTHGLKITTGTVAGHEVPPERSTGSFEADEAIRNGGGIPGGKFPKMGSMNSDLHMFHDPTTGSTLGMSADEISPTAVAKQLAESREIYAQAQAKKKLGIK